MPKNIRRNFILNGLLLVTFSLLTSCAILKPTKPGIGRTVDWDELTDWTLDRHAETWPALLNSCLKVRSRPGWQVICEQAAMLDQPSDIEARQFYENWFRPFKLNGSKRNSKGLITGYYEPLLQGSMTQSDKYKWPIYQQPEDLLIIDLGELYPALANKRVRGRINGNRVLPYYSREQIEADRSLLSGYELLWVDNRDDAFFLQIQGSGRVQLDTGEYLKLGYANQNGHPYHAIGKTLIERGELSRQEVSLFTIRNWLVENPNQAEELLNLNPSYVFFTLKPDSNQGPVGSLNVPLTPERSIAIDPALLDLGVPVWLETNLPGNQSAEYNRLVLAQDTGGAIKGPLRADLFWGHGEDAENAAGLMKERGNLFVLLPKSVNPEDL